MSAEDKTRLVFAVALTLFAIAIMHRLDSRTDHHIQECEIRPSHVIDGLYAIARAVDRLATAIEKCGG